MVDSCEPGRFLHVSFYDEKYVEISTWKAFTFRSNYRQDEYVK